MLNATLPVALLAGGLATRLRPLTRQLPKSLLPVAGRPFIRWQLELLAQQGITEVVVCVGFLADQIQGALGDGAAYGLRLRYSCDGGTALGTGGALRRALPLLGDAAFVLYGDSYLPCDFATVKRAYEDSGAPALLSVLRNDNRWDRSNVLFQEGRITEYNKEAPHAAMRHIDYGLSVVSAACLERFADGQRFELSGLYHDLSLRGELAGFEVSERFYEIGSWQGLADTDRYLRGRTAGQETGA